MSQSVKEIMKGTEKKKKITQKAYRCKKFYGDDDNRIYSSVKVLINLNYLFRIITTTRFEQLTILYQSTRNKDDHKN